MLGIIRKFLNFSGKRNKRLFILSMILGVIYAIGDVVKIYSIFIIVDNYLKGTLTQEKIWLAFGIMCAGLLVMIVCKYVSTLLQCIGGYTTAANKRISLAEHLRYMPMGYYNSHSLGYVTSVATNTMESLGDIATRVVMMVTDGFLDTVLIMVMMFIFDWRMGLIVLGVVILFLLIQTLHQHVGKKLAPIKDESDYRLVEDVLEYTEGIVEVKNYNLVNQASSKIYKSIDDNRKINTKMEFKFSPFDIFEGIPMKVGTILISMLSIIFYINGSIDNLAVVILTIICSFIVFNGLAKTGSYSSLLKNVEIAVDKANRILNEEVMNTKGEDYAPNSSDISVEHISFKYEKKTVINDVSFNIKSNSKIAIVGPSGSGKTTIVKLIARFFDVDSGQIKLDGRNIKDYSIDSLMKNFSFVFQNVYLFNDTIKNNIKIGNDKATDEEIIEACKKARCHDFIMSLKDGYDTVISEGGNSLSGGEKQRISIARAILKDAPIIILDEATANIDPENEELIIEAFNELTKDKTIIMIAHRLKTVVNADQIIVIDNGKIVESGTHKELLTKNGIYSRFVNDRKEAIGFRI